MQRDPKWAAPLRIDIIRTIFKNNYFVKQIQGIGMYVMLDHLCTAKKFDIPLFIIYLGGLVYLMFMFKIFGIAKCSQI